MGNLTHTVSGGIASFRSAARVPIESLKCHFLPVQEGTGDPSPENIRPITGWNGITAYKAKKNIGHIFGYSSSTINSITSSRSLTGGYGNTINTIYYTSSDTAITITQTQWPNTTNKNSYKNGYFCVGLDNLIYDQSYDFSFKITNITNNPLDAALSDIRIQSPGSGTYHSTEIKDNILIFHNIPWRKHSDQTERCSFEIYNCGMSFTMSEFMVTPAETNDGVWEPYQGDIIPVTFPTTGKNRLDPSTYYHSSSHTVNGITFIKNNDGTVTANGTCGDSEVYVAFEWIVPFTTNCYFCSNLSVPYATANIYLWDATLNARFKKWNGTTNSGASSSTTNLQEVQLIKGHKASLRCRVMAGATIENLIFYPMILLDSCTDTTYEQYNNDNTVYGGYIDIAKGEVVAEWKTYTFTGQERMSLSSSYTGTGGVRIDTAALDSLGPAYNDAISNIAYKYPSVPTTVTTLGFRIGGGSSACAFFVPDGLVDGSTTVDKFKTWLTTHELSICTKLATPITLAHLTPIQLKTFLDNNNFWSNTNDITEVSYQIHDSNMIKQVKKNMMAENRIHYKKVLWNNFEPPCSTEYYQPYNSNYIQIEDIEDGIIKQTFLVDDKRTYYTSVREKNEYQPQVYISHKYYVSYMLYTPMENTHFGIECFGGTPFDFGEIPANQWTRLSFYGNGKRDGSGHAYLGNIRTYPEINGYALLKSPIYIDLTLMFGEGNEPSKQEFEELCRFNNIDLTISYPRNIEGITQIWMIP